MLCVCVYWLLSLTLLWGRGAVCAQLVVRQQALVRTAMLLAVGVCVPFFPGCFPSPPRGRPRQREGLTSAKSWPISANFGQHRQSSGDVGQCRADSQGEIGEIRGDAGQLLANVASCGVIAAYIG